MKKVKLSEIYNSVSILNEVLSMKMPVKTSVKVVNIIQELNNHLKDAEEARTKLVDAFGKKNQEGEIAVPDSRKDMFIKELNDKIFFKEVPIYSELLSLEDFDPEFKISPGDFSLINFILK